MKRFMKGCGIAAVIMIGAGLVLALVAGSVRGKLAIEEVVETVTGGKMQVNLDNWEDFGITIGDDFFSELSENLGAEVQYELEDSMIFDDAFEIFEGDAAKSFMSTDIKELNIEVGGCSFQIEASEDENFYLEAEAVKKFQGYVKDSVLHVKGTMSTNKININDTSSKITLYVPKDFVFDKVDMELGAGLMEWKELCAKKADLEVGAGQIVTSSIQVENLDIHVGMGEIVVKEMQVQNLDAEVDMGHFYAKGSITGNAEVECNMGSIEMEIDGAGEDFNYNLECGLGNLQVGNESYSGLGTEKEILNQADKNMDVKCAMGNVEISFKD